jgi:hypothetical protein
MTNRFWPPSALRLQGVALIFNRDAEFLKLGDEVPSFGDQRVGCDVLKELGAHASADDVNGCIF